MSLDVAIQSVAFYVLSCATCSKINHRRKAKAQAKKERAEKQALETEQPGLYRHPSPFSTNPYWEEEIQLGPTPNRKDKGGSKNNSSRALNTAGQGSSVISDGNLSTATSSSPTMVPPDQRLSGDDWNRKRYQREDEELWGQGNEAPPVGQRIRHVLARAEESVGSTLRLIEERLSKSVREEERNPYYAARNPPVNDLHPPVVSTQPTSRGATRWMLQPPPSAKVMEGKERANRPRSESQGSSRKEVDGENLSRQVTARAVEERLRRGETPSELELRSLTRPTSRAKTPAGTGIITPKGLKLGRSRSHSTESANSIEALRRQGRPIPSPFSIAADRRVSLDSIESSDGPVLAPVNGKPEMRENAFLRPSLQTISSGSSMTVPKVYRGSSRSSKASKTSLVTPKPQAENDTTISTPDRKENINLHSEKVQSESSTRPHDKEKVLHELLPSEVECLDNLRSTTSSTLPTSALNATIVGSSKGGD
jgi:hypothetical protein